MKPIGLKKDVIDYRKKGYSYPMISQKFGLAKSTLNNWLRDIPFTPNQELIDRIGMAKVKSAKFKNKQKLDNIKEMRKLADKDIGKLSDRDLFMLGIGLYLGEGSKLYENIRIINSDPEIVKMSMKWFRNVCNLKDCHFVPSVHLYPDTNIDIAILYWSKITGVDKKQFGKTQVDKRENKSKKKRRKLPYGTLHIHIKSCGKKEYGRSLHRRIMGWIEHVNKQI
jgi:hypothetical protein